MTSLIWGVKESLRAYVTGVAGGEFVLSGDATQVEGGFSFPAVSDDPDDGRFTGGVTMIAHDGMMRVTVADPHVHRDDEGWTITIADPDDPGSRLLFATIEDVSTAPDGSRVARGTRLTADGADLFFGPYQEGTDLDDPTIVP